MSAGNSQSNVRFSGDAFPSLGGRGAAAVSEKTWGTSGGQNKSWGPPSTQHFRKPRVASEPRVDNGYRIRDAAATPGSRNTSDTGWNKSDRVCCHFLLDGDCSHGRSCQYKHTRDVNPARTLCGFGKLCRHGHGQALSSASKGDDNRHDVKNPTRACCHYLEGTCNHGANCKFMHWKCDKYSTVCGFGVHCKFGHGRTILEVEDTVGNDNPVLCCHFVEYGRCANGAQCRWRHEKVDDPSKVECGFGHGCKFGHGSGWWYRCEESGQPRDSKQGYTSRDGVTAARYSKAPVRDRFEDAPTAAPKASQRSRKRQEADAAAEVPDAWDEYEGDGDGIVGEQKASHAAEMQQMQSLLPGVDIAGDAVAEDIIGALEQAWESMWSPSNLGVSSHAEKEDDAAANLQPTSDESGDTSNRAVVFEPYDQDRTASVSERASTLDKNQGAAAKVETKKVGSGNLPSWLVRPRSRVRPAEKKHAAGDDQKQMPNSFDDNMQAGEDSRAAETSFPALDEKQLPSSVQQENNSADHESVVAASGLSEVEKGQTHASGTAACTALESDCKQASEEHCQVSFADEEPVSDLEGISPTFNAEGVQTFSMATPPLNTEGPQIFSMTPPSNTEDTACAADPDDQDPAFSTFSERRARFEVPVEATEAQVSACQYDRETLLRLRLTTGLQTKQEMMLSPSLLTTDKGLQTKAVDAMPHEVVEEDTSKESSITKTDESSVPHCISALEQEADSSKDLERQHTDSQLNESIGVGLPGARHIAFSDEETVQGRSATTPVPQRGDDQHAIPKGTDQNTLVQRCLRQQVACCHFLQGWCKRGGDCHYKHEWGLNPARTECEHGEHCAFGHGWAAKASQKPVFGWTSASWEPVVGSEPFPWDQQQPTNRPLFAGDKVHDRACCMFLEYAHCWNGSKCPFKHVLGDPARTVCGYGPLECSHEHGWALGTYQSGRYKATSPSPPADRGSINDGQTNTAELTESNHLEAGGESVEESVPCVSSPFAKKVESEAGSHEAKSTCEVDETKILKTSTITNTAPVPKATRGSACCNFLQFRSCRNGKLCRYQHVQRDPRLTLCGFGTADCYYGHGSGRQAEEEQRQPEKTLLCKEEDALEPDKDMDAKERGQHPYKLGKAKETESGFDDAENRHYRQRICCHFLEYWKCSWGDQCQYKHVKDDSAVTECGYGHAHCRFGHGWARTLSNKVGEVTKYKADSDNRVCSRVCRNFLDGATGNERGQSGRAAWVGGGDAAAGVRIPNAPTKLLRAALTGLLGWWHSVSADKKVQLHEVTMKVEPGCHGYASLSCVSTTKVDESLERISVEGGDIVLGAKGEWFLDASSNRYVTWVNKSKPELTRLWTAGWVDLDQKELEMCDKWEEELEKDLKKLIPSAFQ